MTNTKFRKRALLSSVAMLLVALVALGSATFAWFAANPNAKADGLTLKTTASTGLVVKTDTDTAWSHAAKLGKDGNGTFDINLTPASQAQTDRSFTTIGAAEASAYTAASGADDKFTSNLTVGHTAASEVYSENVYFKLSDGTASTESYDVKLNGIKITGNGNSSSHIAMEKAVRVAIWDGTTLKTYALTGNTGTTGKTVPTGSTGKKMSEITLADYSNLIGDLVDGTQKAQDWVVATGVTATENSAKAITVYIYLDGQDELCYSDAVGTVNAAQMISNVELSFTLGDPTT